MSMLNYKHVFLSYHPKDFKRLYPTTRFHFMHEKSVTLMTHSHSSQLKLHCSRIHCFIKKLYFSFAWNFSLGKIIIGKLAWPTLVLLLQPYLHLHCTYYTWLPHQDFTESKHVHGLDGRLKFAFVTLLFSMQLSFLYITTL